MLVGTNYRRIIHIVSDVVADQQVDPAFDTYWRRLTLIEWAAKRSSHTWLSWNTGEYILGTVV
jgi:hypothetical protein